MNFPKELIVKLAITAVMIVTYLIVYKFIVK